MKNRNKNHYNSNKIKLRDINQQLRAIPAQQTQTWRYLSLHNTVKDQFSFFLLKVLNNNVTSDDTITRHYQMTTNSAVNRNLASVLNK